MRKLDIGPGWDPDKRIPGFETVDAVPRGNVDHVADAQGPLPFPDNTFEIVHASHVLEHIPWQYSDLALQEWVRILKPGGWLEVWVPNALKVAEAFVEGEKGRYGLAQKSPLWNKSQEGKGTWECAEVRRDPCRLANGYILTFVGGIECGDVGMHRAIFSPRYLKKLMKEAGLVEVQGMKKDQIRAHHYRWVNMGVKGKKPNQ